MEKPGEGEGDDDAKEEGAPIAEVPALNFAQGEADVYKITFETEPSDKADNSVYDVGQAAKHSVEQQHGGNGKWNIQHTLNKQRELAMQILLKEDA